LTGFGSLRSYFRLDKIQKNTKLVFVTMDSNSLSKIATVSVIIPAYNAGLFLRETLLSVFDQTYKDFEMIVIDDGSTDNTSMILDELRQKVKSIKQSNRGPSAARNAGVNLAQGKYLVFLDSDDLMLPGMLSEQVKYLEAHPELSLVYSNGYRFRVDKNGEETRELMTKTGEIIPLTPQSNPSEMIIPRNLFPIDVAMVKRDAVLEVGCFDESLSSIEDWDLWFRILTKYPAAYLDLPAAKYRIRPGSNSSDTLRNLRDYEKVMEKIYQSSVFQNCQNKDICAEFYYVRAVVSILLADTERARQLLLTVLQLKPGYIKARIGILLIAVFKSKTHNIFKLKRKIFGINQTHLI
jgi:glycosyltransferase involved in cell wall biosynthesis